MTSPRNSQLVLPHAGTRFLERRQGTSSVRVFRSRALCAVFCFAAALALVGPLIDEAKLCVALSSILILAAAFLDQRLAWVLFFTAVASTGLTISYATATIRPELLAAPLLFAAVRRSGAGIRASATRGFARTASYVCLAGLLVIGFSTSVFIARVPSASLWIFAQLAFAIFCLVWIRRSGSDRVQMVKVGSVVMTAISILGIAAWVLGHIAGWGLFSFALSGDGRIQGLSFEPNIFASQSLGWLAVLYARRKELERGVLLSSVPMIAALLLAGTRAAWVGLAFMAFVIVVRALRRPALLLVSLLGGLATAAVGAQVLAGFSASGATTFSANPVAWRLTHLFDTSGGTGAYRVDTARLALQDISASGRWIFGDGMNSYRQHHLMDITNVGPAYLGSLWYELLYDVGIVGLACFVGFLILNFVSSSRPLDVLPLYVGLLVCATATNIVWLAFMWVYFALAEKEGPPDRMQKMLKLADVRVPEHHRRRSLVEVNG